MIKFLPTAYGFVEGAYFTLAFENKYPDSTSRVLSPSYNIGIHFMELDGGLVEGKHFSSLISILSGPAGGVVG